MTKEEVIKTLEEYNKWRKGADTPQIHPRIIGKAIEEAIKLLKTK